MSEVTLDPRYRSRLEQELGQADEAVKARDEIIRRQNAEIAPLRAERDRLKPLADAALDHRQKADEARTAAKAATARAEEAERLVAALQRNLDQAEASIALREKELSAKDALHAEVVKLLTQDA